MTRFKSSLFLVFLLVSPCLAQASGFTDSFASGSLDPAWSVHYANADNYSISYVNATYSVSGGQLVIEDVVSTASGGHTADFILRRTAGGLSDFDATFDFEWDMRRPGSDNIVEHRKAMPRILIRLLDATGATVVEAGLEDRVYSGSTGPFGDFVADTALPSKAAGFLYTYRETNPDHIGASVFRLVRVDGAISIYRGASETPVFTGEDDRQIASVEMVFGQRHLNGAPDAFFGEARVNQVSITGAEGPPPTYAELFDLINRRYDMNSFADNPLSNAVGWGAGNILMAYLAKFEATGDVQYLGMIKIHAEKIFANRADRLGLMDEVRGKFMPAWTSTAYSDGQHHAWLVHAGNFLFPVVRAAYLINQDPGLREDFGYFADWAVAEAIEVMEGFEAEDWYNGPGTGEGHFRGLPDPARVNDPLPYNMMHTAGRTYVALWLATGEERFREKAERLARFWRNRMNTPSNRFTWSYSTYFPNRMEDLSHGAISVDFAFHAFRAGIFFTEDDMDRLIATLQHTAQEGSGFSLYVDGTGDLSQSDQAHRWMHLAFLDPDLIDLYHPWLLANWNTAAPLQMVHATAYMEEVSTLEFAPETPHPPSGPATPPPAPGPGLNETFDRNSLFNHSDRAGPQWFSTAHPLALIGATYAVQDGQLEVYAIDTTASGNFVPDVRFTRPIRPVSGDFSLTYDFGWDMRAPGDILTENRKAVPRILIRLLDAEGNTVAEAGLEDRVYSGATDSFGRLVAGVNVTSKTGGYSYPYSVSNADVAGDAFVRIEREEGTLSFYFGSNQQPVLTAASAATITDVELVFGRMNISSVADEFFGLGIVREVKMDVPGLTFAAWREANFDPGDWGDPEVSGPQADPGGFGITNLARYAFGMSAAFPERELLPMGDTVSVAGECRPAFAYSRIEATDLEYRIEVSSDLVDWRSADGEIEVHSVTSAGEGERVVVRSMTSCDDLDRLFFRLILDLAD